MDHPEGWTAETVRANGVDLQCYRTGEGPPLVLAHGFYDDARCWAPLAADLADDYELLLYDARGHGGSAAPDSGYAMADRVADLGGLIDALDLHDPILVGHSMGASTVAWTAATHPDLPRAAVLEDPAGMMDAPDSTPEQRASFVRERVQEWDATSADELVAEHDWPADLERWLAAARQACRPAIANVAREGFPPSVEAFPDVECPTLVLKADADPATRADELAAADELPDGRLVHVPGAGHTVVRDRYDAAVRELRAFLRRV